MTWRTVILTKDSKISLRLDHLIVEDEKVTTVPLTEIGQLIIENPNIIMTGHILNALSKYKITTIICDERHLSYAQVNLIYGHIRQTNVIKKQFNWEDEQKELLWKYIIKQKIYNQKKLLQSWYGGNYEILSNYISQVEIGDETNREGHAAKVYFNELYGKDFIRGRDDPINWALNYGYSLIHSLLTRVIITKGLLTEIGIHHHNQFNQYNLASDFIEVYRPLIDYIVKKNINNSFERKHRRKLINVFNKKVLIRNSRQYLANSVEIYVDGLIRFLNEGEKGALYFPTMIYKEMG